MALLGNFWQQSRENSKTREDLRGDIKDLDDKLSGQIKVLDDKLRGDIKVLDDKLRGQIKVLGIGLGYVRERLAGIEGYLRIGMAQPAETPASD